MENLQKIDIAVLHQESLKISNKIKVQEKALNNMFSKIIKLYDEKDIKNISSKID